MFQSYCFLVARANEHTEDVVPGKEFCIIEGVACQLPLQATTVLQTCNTVQGRNHGENLGSTSVMVGRISPPWLG